MLYVLGALPKYVWCQVGNAPQQKELVGDMVTLKNGKEATVNMENNPSMCFMENMAGKKQGLF